MNDTATCPNCCGPLYRRLLESEVFICTVCVGCVVPDPERVSVEKIKTGEDLLRAVANRAFVDGVREGVERAARLFDMSQPKVAEFIRTSTKGVLY